MKTKTIQSITMILSILLGNLLSILLSACQMVPPVVENASANVVGNQPVNAVPSPTPQSTTRPTLQLIASPTMVPTVDAKKAHAAGAEQAARDYFASLEGEDFEQAAGQLSTFSLMVAHITHGDAAAALNKMKTEGAHWSELQIMESRSFNEQTMLVHVTYSLSGKDAKDGKETQETRDELWPIRLENGTWRYNWNNLIDYHALLVDDQTVNGVTVKPVQLRRYSDRTQLILLVQNRTNNPVVFGQVNEILGTFHFGAQTIEAEKTRTILNPLRSVPDVTLEVKGLFAQYPDSIEIRKWKNYNVKPWYVFQLQ